MQQRKQNMAVGTQYVPNESRNDYFDITVPPPRLRVIANSYYGNEAKRRERRLCRILMPLTVLTAAVCLGALVFLSTNLLAQGRQLSSLNQRSNMLSVQYDNYESKLASVTYEDTVRGIAENTFGMYIPER